MSLIMTMDEWKDHTSMMMLAINTEILEECMLDALAGSSINIVMPETYNKMSELYHLLKKVHDLVLDDLGERISHHVMEDTS